MNATLVRLAPTALVMAVGGYTVWPYLGPDAPGAAPAPVPAAAAKPKADPAGDATAVPVGFLDPQPVPPPGRDPFEDPEVMRRWFRETVRQRLAALEKQLAERGKFARPKAPKRGTRPGGGSGPSPLEGLTLHATYIQGNGAGAVINGKVFAVGQPLRPAEPQGEPPPVLKEVRAHSVVIHHLGEDHELKYPALGQAGPARATRAAAPRRPASPRTPKTASR